MSNYYQTELETKACEVILGSLHEGAAWDGENRVKKLGKDYEDVQAIINAMMKDEPTRIIVFAAFVLDGHAGNGDERKALLGPYAKRVQVEVNYICKVAQAIADGSTEYGNGEDRKKKLGIHYYLIQQMVNKILAERPLTQKELDVIVAGVWAGDYGAGEVRKKKLGHRYEQVQQAINDGLVLIKKSSVPKLSGRLAVFNFPTKGRKRNFFVYGQGSCAHEYIRGSGCALCAGLTVYSSSGDAISPDTFYDKYAKSFLGVSLPTNSGRPVAPYGLQVLLSHKNIMSDWVPYKKTGFMHDDIIPHLRSGQPVLVWMGSSVSQKYTRSVHTVVLAGITEDGKGVYLDSGAKTWDGYQRAKLVDLNDVANHMWFCDKGKASKQILWGGHSSTTGYIKVYLK